MATSLIESVTAADAKDTAALKQEYRELLLRTNAAKKGDADRLREVVQALGKPAAQLPRDLATLETAARLERQSADANNEELLMAATAAHDKYADACDEHRGIVAKCNEVELSLHTKWVQLQNQISRAQNRRRDLKCLQRENRTLFGLPPRPPKQPTTTVIGAVGSAVPGHRTDRNEERAKPSHPPAAQSAWQDKDGSPSGGPS